MTEPKTQILIVEDDVRTAETVELYLLSSGFETTVAHTGPQALALTNEKAFDLVLLDIMLPGIDGWTLCRRLREHSDAGIILVSALSTLDDKIEGLGLGADDYVTKPFSPRELVARARAVLRRRSGRAQRILRLGDLRLDRDRSRAYVGPRELDLTPSEYRLFEALLAAPGRLFTRTELVDRVEGDCNDRTVDSHVANLRRKLSTDEPQRFVETVFGRGYRLREKPP
ncbi:MAG: response regulator transcription factor [Thermoanaerobaculia bacterium]|nr:response regulator transcription factor [Thermoanaerobaculia bacterium]